MQRAAIVSGDFVRTGGMDMPNFALALHLANCGVSVELVAHRIHRDLLKHSGVRFHRVPKPFGSYLLGSPFWIARGGEKPAKRWLGAGGPW